MKTPIQLLIQQYERLQNDAKTFQERLFFDGIIAVAKTMLPTEKEHFEKAVNDTSKKDVELANNAIAAYSKIKGKFFAHDDKEGQKYFEQNYYKQDGE